MNDKIHSPYSTKQPTRLDKRRGLLGHVVLGSWKGAWPVPKEEKNQTVYSAFENFIFENFSIKKKT